MQVKVGLSHHIVDLGNIAIENDKPVVFNLDAKSSANPGDGDAPEEPPKKKQKKDTKKTKKKEKTNKDKKAHSIPSNSCQP